MQSDRNSGLVDLIDFTGTSLGLSFVFPVNNAESNFIFAMRLRIRRQVWFWFVSDFTCPNWYFYADLHGSTRNTRKLARAWQKYRSLRNSLTNTNFYPKTPIWPKISRRFKISNQLVGIAIYGFESQISGNSSQRTIRPDRTETKFNSPLKLSPGKDKFGPRRLSPSKQMVCLA